MWSETTEPESAKLYLRPETTYSFLWLGSWCHKHSQATGHTFPWKLWPSWHRRASLGRGAGGWEFRISKLRSPGVGMKDSAHDIPMASLGTQQTLLVSADKVLGGHPAEEADMGLRKTAPTQAPQVGSALPTCSALQHLSPLMSMEASASQLPALCPAPALLPCLALPHPTPSLCPGGPAHWMLRAPAPELLPSLC